MSTPFPTGQLRHGGLSLTRDYGSGKCDFCLKSFTRRAAASRDNVCGHETCQRKHRAAYYAAKKSKLKATLQKGGAV